jgi:hypothetical protein
MRPTGFNRLQKSETRSAWKESSESAEKHRDIGTAAKPIMNVLLVIIILPPIILPVEVESVRTLLIVDASKVNRFNRH